jgi:hypothetical protein
MQKPIILMPVNLSDLSLITQSFPCFLIKQKTVYTIKEGDVKAPSNDLDIVV